LPKSGILIINSVFDNEILNIKSLNNWKIINKKK